MSVIYSPTIIDARLQGVVTGLGNASHLLLNAGGTTVSTIQMGNPAGTVSGGVLTFGGTLLDTSAAGTGNVDSAVINDSLGNLAISGLTVGIPGGSQDIIISNGLNSTLITAGQIVALLSAQITGS
jgi:hypothetical protein